MANCAEPGVDNYVWVIDAPPFGCRYVMLEYDDYQKLESIGPSLDGDITILPDVYVAVSGYLLLSFVSGHVLGRILKTLGKG